MTTNSRVLGVRLLDFHIPSHLQIKNQYAHFFSSSERAFPYTKSLHLEGVVVTALLSHVAVVLALLCSGTAPLSALSDRANPPFCDTNEASVGLVIYQRDRSANINRRTNDCQEQDAQRNKPFCSFLVAGISSAAPPRWSFWRACMSAKV